VKIDTAAKLGRNSAAFGLAVAIIALFNTVLACAKDAYQPLNLMMNKIAGHNWTTQGLADVILFLGLGLTLSQTNAAGKMSSRRVISFLVVSVVIAGAGLFTWYLLY
jgi:hypothetical protein